MIDSSWADRYERLRRCGLEFGSRLRDDAEGLILFVRQGMVSWMNGLAAVVRRPPARASLPERDVCARDDGVEVTRMLASMIGAALTEVR